MPMHIQRIDSHVTVDAAGSTLGETELEQLAARVAERLKRDERRERRLDAMMRLRSSAEPPLPTDREGPR
jgi:hypothetical protein